MVINGDVGILRTDASDAGPAVAMNPVTDPSNARERFDIEMDQVSAMRPFVAGDRGRRRKPRQPIETGTHQHRRHGRPGHLELHADRLGRAAFVASRDDAGRDGRRRSVRLTVWGRGAILERSRPTGAVPGQPFVSAPDTNPSRWLPPRASSAGAESGRRAGRAYVESSSRYDGASLGVASRTERNVW
jgi:hypothetical protein